MPHSDNYLFTFSIKRCFCHTYDHMENNVATFDV